MKTRFFIPACALSAAAVVFVIFAMGHPELSFPWDNWVTLLNILTIILLLGAVFFLVQSILSLFPDGHTNWCLPFAQGLTCIALFLNLAQIRKNRKDYRTNE